MSYVDAHLHLADPGYAGRIPAIIENATKNNVSHLLSNAMDYQTSVETLEIARKYEPIVLGAIGVHPWTANNNADCQLDKFEELIEKNEGSVKALGEIGLDGKYSQSAETRKRQREVFEFFLRIAERRELPVIVHSRLAVNEVLETLSKFRLRKVLLHWYDGPIEKLPLIGERDYLISIGPAVQYSRRMSEIARSADLGMILTETDGPVTYRGAFHGQATMPSFVIDVVRKLAEVKSLSLETTREVIMANFEKLVSM